MRTDSELPLTHTSARMMKLATGIAFTSCITGASRASTHAQRPEATASTTLDTAPSPKPSRMRPALKPMRCQNSAWGSSSSRVPSVCTGDTRKTSCPTAMAAACQTASQNPAAAHFARRLFFVCFIAFVRSFPFPVFSFIR